MTKAKRVFPRTLAYFIALAVLFVSACVVCFGLMYVRHWRFSLLGNEVQSDLIAGEFGSARRIIREFRDNTSLDAQPSRLLTTVNTSRIDLAEALVALLEANKTLRLPAIQTAHSRLTSLVPQFAIVEDEEGTEEESSETFEGALHNIISLSRKVVKLGERGMELERQIQGLREERELMEKQFNALAQNFADLFTWNPEPHSTEKDGPLAIYASGALKGLPRLDSIPDGLADLGAFRDRLIELGLNVQLTAEEFSEKVDALSVSLAPVLNKDERAIETLRTWNKELEEVKAEKAVKTARIEQIVSPIVSELLQSDAPILPS